MTITSLYHYGKSTLISAGFDNASFDALCLLEHCLNSDKTFIVLHGNDKVQDEIVSEYKGKISRRLQNEPLQYILGEWEFMGLPFIVGQGVLIPRPETEQLVEITIEELKNRGKTVVFDLCSGTGCIGISVAALCNNAEVYLIEKSSDAIKYLNANIIKHGLNTVTVIQGDILKGFENFDLPKPDIILSNPPYIPTEELMTLQAEVKKEPPMALDGGADGLCFYRAIRERWFPYLNSKGFLAVECGDGQAADITELFSHMSLKMETIKDLSSIERVVFIKK